MLAVLRIVTALFFLTHGTAKMFGFPDVRLSAPLFSLLGLAAILEIAGGILLVIGLFTRPVAFILAGEMAVAYQQRQCQVRSSRASPGRSWLCRSRPSHRHPFLAGVSDSLFVA